MNNDDNDSNTGKAPAFQFYPGDYLKDPAVRSVSLAARGLWMDMICLMWESQRKGYLEHSNGKPVTADQLSRMVGAPKPEVIKLLQELESCGVYSISEGIIYCRRIVRDIRKRELCREAGKRGGNPKLKGTDNGTLKGQDKQDANPNLTPSSSSSTSSSTSVNQGGSDVRMDRWDLDETYMPLVKLYRDFQGKAVIDEDFREAWMFTWRHLDYDQKQERIDALRWNIENDTYSEPSFLHKPLKFIQSEYQRERHPVKRDRPRDSGRVKSIYKPIPKESQVQ